MNIGSKDSRLQVALIGLGVGRNHLNTIESNEFCEVRQICDFSQQKLDEAGAQFPGAALTTNSAAAITDPSVDLVVISSYDDHHFNEVMQQVGFYEVDNPRQLLTRTRRFFRRSKIDHLEANIFRGIFAAIQKKLKK